MRGGLLLVDKPQGWTSHDAVVCLRRLFPPNTKVGHTGTLDPMATGLLVILVGQATKQAAFYQKLPKTYSGSIRLGMSTNTGDLEGESLGGALPPPLSSLDLQRLLDQYLGDIEIPVPQYSAAKYRGKPLYAYARQGLEVPARKRFCRIEEWRLSDWQSPELFFRIRCSSGTYLRSLAVLLGERLGCGAVLSALRRESVGNYHISKAITMERARSLAGGLEKFCMEVLP